MLTGKAKSDFEKWYWNDWLTGSDRDYHEKDEVIENSWKAEKLFLFPLIIEWLDSVGIYVDVEFFRKDIKDEAKFVSGTTDCKNGFRTLGKEFNSRQQATEQAIIRANEIYNGN